MAQYNLDWSKGDEPVGTFVRPGRHLGEVERVEEFESRGGDPGVRLFLREAKGAKRTICRDVIMLSGKGWSIGKRKLKAFGFTEKDPVLKPSSLVGKWVYVTVVEGIRNEKRFNEVDIDASEFCGYEPEAAGENAEPQPDPIPLPGEPIDPDDTPF
jgi:hypothetical protein